MTAPQPDVTAGEVTIPGYAAYLRHLWARDPERFLLEHPGVIEQLLNHTNDAELVRQAAVAAAGRQLFHADAEAVSG